MFFFIIAYQNLHKFLGHISLFSYASIFYQMLQLWLIVQTLPFNIVENLYFYFSVSQIQSM